MYRSFASVSRQIKWGGRRKRNSRFRITTPLGYNALEPRKLLAADLVLDQPQFFQLDPGVSDSANMVVNGDFEMGVAHGTGLVDDSTVDGWSAVDSDQKLGLIELQNPHSQILQLDSSADRLERVFQDVPTEAGVSYLLAFDLRERPVGMNADENTNRIDVFWNNESIGVFSGVAHWQSIAVQVVGAQIETRLEFHEISESARVGGDGRGPLIDNVRVVKTLDRSITNGSFESVANGVNRLASNDEISGWNAVATAGERQIEIVQSPQAKQGQRFLSLDSSSSYLDRVYQDISTVDSVRYYITFNLSSSTSSPNEAEQLRIRWNDQWAGTFQSGTEWQSFGILVTATSDLTRLTFREPGGEFGNGTGDGNRIDNVRIFRVAPVATDLKVDLSGSDRVNFADDQGPQDITSNSLRISNQAGSQLSAAWIRIEDQRDGASEMLTVDELADNRIRTTYDSAAGVLRLSGVDSIGNYRALLRTLKYENQSEDASGANRSVSITIVDEGVPSAKAFISISILANPSSPIPDDFVPFSGNGQLSNVRPDLRNEIYDAPPEMTIDLSKTYDAVIRTINGDMRIRLFDDESPITVNSFINLAKDGYYDGLTFHRVIEDFVAQGGDPLASGRGGPGYQFEDEFVNGLEFDRRGLVAMANSGPNTNGSQFFITYAPQRHLDGLHTIFGELIEGEDVLDQITAIEPGVESSRPDIIFSVSIIES